MFFQLSGHTSIDVQEIPTKCLDSVQRERVLTYVIPLFVPVNPKQQHESIADVVYHNVVYVIVVNDKATVLARVL